MRFFTALLAVTAALPSVLSAVIPDEVLSFCKSPTILSQTLIGQNEDVKIEAWQCDDTYDRREMSIEKRQTNVCGATCE